MEELELPEEPALQNLNKVATAQRVAMLVRPAPRASLRCFAGFNSRLATQHRWLRRAQRAEQGQSGDASEGIVIDSQAQKAKGQESELTAVVQGVHCIYPSCQT